MTSCLPREFSVVGNGQSQVNLFVGLVMVNGAMVKNFGNWQVCDSTPSRFPVSMGISKSGARD